MKKNRLFGLLLLIVFQWPLAANALPFSDLYVFGDSLSDQGNVFLRTSGAVPPPEYTDGTNIGRFTNGLNYIDHLSAGLGLNSTPALLGGNNYASGGARTDSHRLDSLGIGARNLLQQRDAYITGLSGPADADALYVVWAGANNVTDILEKSVVDPFYDPTADLTKSIFDLSDVIGSLAAVGAQNILVANLPNLGDTPNISAFGPAAVAGAQNLSLAFNANLDLALDSIELGFPTTDIIRFDTFAFLDNIVQDPGSFGFTNITDACYSLFVEAGGTTCANPDQYLSWDGFHPGSVAHKLIATEMLASLQTVPEPGTYILIGLGLLGFVVRKKSPR